MSLPAWKQAFEKAAGSRTVRAAVSGKDAEAALAKAGYHRNSQFVGYDFTGFFNSKKSRIDTRRKGTSVVQLEASKSDAEAVEVAKKVADELGIKVQIW